MLFDLRSRGRRRTVKTVYIFLAILMGSGLVLFGIGGATSGGLLNAFNGSTSGSSGNTVDKSLKGLEKAVRRNPRDVQAWNRLVTLRYQVATSSAANFNQNTSTFSAAGKAALGGVSTAWLHYIALKPARPDVGLANTMESVYGVDLNQPANAVKTVEFEIAATKRPGAQLFERYALWSSLAGQTRKAGLAQTQAEALVSAGKTGKARAKAIATVPATIAALKAQVAQDNPSATTATPTPTPTTAPGAATTAPGAATTTP
jgi:hypothetical protein